MQMFWEWLRSEEGRIVVSGALGGTAKWLALKQKWPDNIISVLLGVICAFGLGPVALQWLSPILQVVNVTGTTAATLSGFLAGVGGTAIIGFIIDAWNIRRTLLRSKGGSDDAEA